MSQLTADSSHFYTLMINGWNSCIVKKDMKIDSTCLLGYIAGYDRTLGLCFSEGYVWYLSGSFIRKYDANKGGNYLLYKSIPVSGSGLAVENDTFWTFSFNDKKIYKIKENEGKNDK